MSAAKTARRIVSRIVSLIILLLLVGEVSGITNVTPINRMFPVMLNLDFDGKTAYKMNVEEPNGFFTIMSHIYIKKIEGLTKEKMFYIIKGCNLTGFAQNQFHVGKIANLADIDEALMYIRVKMKPDGTSAQLSVFTYKDGERFGPLVGNVPTNELSHFAYVNDGLKLVFYINGVRKGDVSSPSLMKKCRNFQIGGTQGDNNLETEGHKWFTGSLKNFTYLKDKLTDAQVLAAAENRTLFRPFSIQATITGKVIEGDSPTAS